MNELLITIIAAIVLILFGFIGLAFGYYARRRKRSRCACDAANQAMNQIAARKKLKKQSQNYDRKTLDPGNLPLIEQ
ncbi:MAG: hypothetical protein LBT05_10365 [Planctomycetaceae bacterium]|jgi:hypothetical protein|nr:hypothetical protein [Planctomycetaceae bacterium]